jgi:hypothetical protein
MHSLAIRWWPNEVAVGTSFALECFEYHPWRRTIISIHQCRHCPRGPSISISAPFHPCGVLRETVLQRGEARRYCRWSELTSENCSFFYFSDASIAKRHERRDRSVGLPRSGGPEFAKRSMGAGFKVRHLVSA